MPEDKNKKNEIKSLNTINRLNSFNISNDSVRESDFSNDIHEKRILDNVNNSKKIEKLGNDIPNKTKNVKNKKNGYSSRRNNLSDRGNNDIKSSNINNVNNVNNVNNYDIGNNNFKDGTVLNTGDVNKKDDTDNSINEDYIKDLNESNNNDLFKKHPKEKEYVKRKNIANDKYNNPSKKNIPNNSKNLKKPGQENVGKRLLKDSRIAKPFKKLNDFKNNLNDIKNKRNNPIINNQSLLGGNNDDKKNQDSEKDEAKRDKSIVSDSSSYDSRKTTNGKGLLDFSGDLFGKLPFSVKVAIISFVIIFILIFLIFIVITASLSSDIASYEDIAGPSSSADENTGDYEYSDKTMTSDDAQRFYDRVAVIKREFYSKGYIVSPTEIGAVYHIIHENNNFYDYDEMTYDVLENMVDLMYYGKVVEKESIKSNLVRYVFPKFVPDKNSESYKSMAEDVYDYLDEYYDYAGIDENDVENKEKEEEDDSPYY